MAKQISLVGISATAHVMNWIESSDNAVVLNKFDDVINFVNQDNELLSIVNSKISNGPYNLVVDKIPSKILEKQCQIQYAKQIIAIGNLSINLSNLTHWQTILPEIKLPHQYLDKLFLITTKCISHHNVQRIFSADYKMVGKLERNIRGKLEKGKKIFVSGLVGIDTSKIIAGAGMLSGLGYGLTPSGDDYLLGVMAGMWLISPDQAKKVCKAIIIGVRDRTNTLSAAWIQSMAVRKAGVRWHNFFHAIRLQDEFHTKRTAEELLNVGNSSGVDSMIGFLDLLSLYINAR